MESGSTGRGGKKKQALGRKERGGGLSLRKTKPDLQIWRTEETRGAGRFQRGRDGSENVHTKRSGKISVKLTMPKRGNTIEENIGRESCPIWALLDIAHYLNAPTEIEGGTLQLKETEAEQLTSVSRFQGGGEGIEQAQGVGGEPNLRIKERKPGN